MPHEMGEDGNARTALDGAEFLEMDRDTCVKANREDRTVCAPGAQGRSGND